MVAGRTGGHIFPALAVADALTTRWRGRQETSGPPQAGCEIEFLGTEQGLEARLIPAHGFCLRTVPAAGLKGISGSRKLRNLMMLPRSALASARVLRGFRPHVVVGVGGYLAGPVMLEASLLNTPTVLIEPNAVPGFTNRVLAPVVGAAALAFHEAVRFYGAKACVTGLPVRKEFGRIAPKRHVPPYTILVSGGSQGSAAINACLIQALPMLGAGEIALRFIHQTGEKDLDRVRAAYQQWGVEAEITAFIQDMPRAFAEADLIIARSGALTVGELAAAGKAALLIPFPSATDQHQLANARALERVGAARVIEQAKLTPERLVKELTDLLVRAECLTEMEGSARSLARLNAAERIADLVEDLVFGHRPAAFGRPSSGLT
jgi:UDP-N-acetylglucosamine--N-acetylmuramyl-(pentapeptide) pyrophosphoryl-undecaprenol N-acetylglucosamine transferase